MQGALRGLSACYRQRWRWRLQGWPWREFCFTVWKQLGTLSPERVLHQRSDALIIWGQWNAAAYILLTRLEAGAEHFATGVKYTALTFRLILPPLSFVE